MSYQRPNDVNGLQEQPRQQAGNSAATGEEQPAAVAPERGWSSGCHDPASCERHRMCMYHNCIHTGRGAALGDDIDDRANQAITPADAPAAELVERLRAACVGHPYARIPWPHRLLHDAIAEIERLRTAATIAPEAKP